MKTILVIVALLGCVSRLTSAEPVTSQPGEAAVKKVSLKEFDALRAGDNCVVLDVRTPREFAAGHVPGAMNVDWHARDFADQVAKLDKSKKYCLHCLGGVRSAAAGKKLATMGFAELFDYAGGWAEYAKAGEPVEK